MSRQACCGCARHACRLLHFPLMRPAGHVAPSSASAWHNALDSMCSVHAACRRQRSNPIDAIAERVQAGPLLLLKRCYQQRARVRVLTRHARGVRGSAEGTPLCVWVGGGGGGGWGGGGL